MVEANFLRRLSCFEKVTNQILSINDVITSQLTSYFVFSTGAVGHVRQKRFASPSRGQYCYIIQFVEVTRHRINLHA